MRLKTATALKGVKPLTTYIGATEKNIKQISKGRYEGSGVGESGWCRKDGDDISSSQWTMVERN
jgi:hypothetical protein